MEVKVTKWFEVLKKNDWKLRYGGITEELDSQKHSIIPWHYKDKLFLICLPNKTNKKQNELFLTSAVDNPRNIGDF